MLAQAAQAPPPAWAWGALLAVVGLVVALASWALRQLFEDLRASNRALREQLIHVEAKVDSLEDKIDAVRGEMHDTIPALRNDVAQARAIQVGNDRRLTVLEIQATHRSALREADVELLERWAKKDREG